MATVEAYKRLRLMEEALLDSYLNGKTFKLMGVTCKVVPVIRVTDPKDCTPCKQS